MHEIGAGWPVPEKFPRHLGRTLMWPWFGQASNPVLFAMAWTAGLGLVLLTACFILERSPQVIVGDFVEDILRILKTVWR